jgi:uncharacterized protein DUF4336
MLTEGTVLTAKPMSVLKQIDDELWICETPLSFLGLQLGRRMAVIRLPHEELLIHSPAELVPELRDELDRLGQVRHVVPASALHGHLFMEQYRAAYPSAHLYAAPGLQHRRRELSFDRELGDGPEPAWRDELEQTHFRFSERRFGTEVLFCHRRSRTLLVGDLVWNVTSEMPLPVRIWAGWRTGVRPTPLFRLAIRDRESARASLERVLGWDFDRLLLGHGPAIATGGRSSLQRAYAFMLDR